MSKKRTTGLGIFCITTVLLVLTIEAAAYGQGTAFNYQGRLTNDGAPADGLFEFDFKVFDAVTGGNQVGPDLAPQLIQVSNGVLTAQLDFGAGVFTGAARFLEIGVRPAGSPNPYTVLTPRQGVSSIPYTIRSISAASADTATSANQLGGLPASGFIQNSTSPQAATNFNISGNGTAAGTLSANRVNAATEYGIGNMRILSNAGTNNLFAGVLAGSANTTGGSNAFFGAEAGRDNTTGGSNAFFGAQAGRANNTGGSNAFFGALAGLNNTDGDFNAFFGRSAGVNNTTGGSNAFFGSFAGAANNTGSDNAFFGAEAGNQTTTGTSNAFFGRSAGRFNTTGGGNSFFGHDAGRVNVSGSANTFVGAQAGKSNTGSFNSFFGSLAGLANNSGEDNAFFGSFTGTTNTTGSRNAFYGRSAGQQNNTGFDNTFFGFSAGSANTQGNRNSFIGENSGSRNTTGSDNTFVGKSTGLNNITGSLNTFIGFNAGAGFTNSTNATALGSRALANCNDCIILGSINGLNGATASTNVGIGTAIPEFRLHLAENSAAKPGSSFWTVASDRRLKQNIRPYTDGLATLLQLHPVWYRYNGQAGLPADKDYVGVIAQEAQAVAPYTVSSYRAKLHSTDAVATELLHFDGGPLTFMTINAVRELHAQMARLQVADAGDLGQLRAENAALQQRVNDLEQRLAALEQRVSKLTNKEIKDDEIK